MSVAFARAWVAGMRHNGVTVHEWPGWGSRGNGQTSDYQGHLWHHTASPFGSAYSTLVTGRADLPGPLCNATGNDDGSVTVIAAHPANHAGASGGRSMGPLPVTRIFNKYVWGLEIVYPGTVPMRDAQYRTALISAGVVSTILKRPSAEWCRQHAETSITGKWDPGYAPNKTYDGNKMRAGAWSATLGEPTRDDNQEDKMFLAMGDKDNNKLPDRVGLLSGGIFKELSAGELITSRDTIERQGADMLWVSQGFWDWWVMATQKQLGS